MKVLVVSLKVSSLADSDSNICKKKGYKKNFFCLVISKIVYVFNHQQLNAIKYFILFYCIGYQLLTRVNSGLAALDNLI